MPIAVDGTAARELAPRFAEALELVRNEFEGLDTYRQYRNAFARLLKPDPLGRVRMLGTNQRDLFVPELRRVIQASLRPDGQLLDVGAGDGQTFALVADVVPDGTCVSIEEPNPDYVASYAAFLGTQARLRPGMALVAGFDEIDAAAARNGAALPMDGSVDLCVALHMIYFVADLPAALVRMARFLRPGGTLFVVFADETDGYTGQALTAFLDAGGDTGGSAAHLAVIAERRRLLAAPADGGGAIADVLGAAGLPIELTAHRQPSRLYGHTLADLIALASITVLSQVEGVEKFDVAAELLHRHPERVDLRIEDCGPRMGMWSVAQPQWVAVIRRTG